MKPRFDRRRLLLLTKALVSVALLAWLGREMLRRDGVDGLLDRVGALETPWLIAAVGLHFAAVLAGVSRWRLLLGAARIELSFAWLLRSFLIGRFVGAFTPSTTGLDGWRLWEAGRESGRMSASAAVIVVEKLVGLVGMAAVCAALVPFGGADLLGPGALVSAAAIGAAAVLGLLLLRHPGWLEAIGRRAPSKVAGRLEQAVDALRSTRPSRASIVGAVARGIVSHLSLSAVFVATAYALGLEVEVGTLLIVGNAICLAVLLPVSIGGVGVREGVAVALLGAVAIGPTDAVLVALLGYLTGQLPALVGGAAMALSRREAPAPAPALATADSTLS